MAKIVKDDWEFKVERVAGEMQYSAHYQVSTEYGDLPPKGCPILSHNADNPSELPQFSQQEEIQILNFIMGKIRPKVEAYEAK